MRLTNNPNTISLHRRAYQHKVANIVEHMICDALQLANDHLRLPGKDGKLVKMSDAIYDMVSARVVMLSSSPH